MKHAALLAFLAIALLTSGAAQAQKQQTFLRLTDDAGNTISGTSTGRGFERQVEAWSFSAPTQQEPLAQFSMDVQPASGTLKNLQQQKRQLGTVVITVTQSQGEQGLATVYTVRLESAAIVDCRDVNVNGTMQTQVTLRPARSGTTYYQYDRRTGTTRVGSKTGYDWQNNRPWTAF